MEAVAACPSSAGGVRLLDDDPESAVRAITFTAPGGLIVTNRGLFVIGQDADGAAAVLVVDAAASEIGLVTLAGESRLSVDLPRLADLSDALAGAIGHARRLINEGRHGEPVRFSLGRLGLEVQVTGPGGSWLSLGGLRAQFGALQVWQIAAELQALIVREAAASLEGRAALESLLTQTTDEAPTHA
jgi:hypothetical protein